MEFQVDRIEPNGLVVGRNGDADIPVGAIFVSLEKVRVDGDAPDLTSVELGITAVDLRLTEVHWFRTTIDAIPRGHSAGLRLDGVGLEAIASALASRREREFLYIRTGASLSALGR